LIENKTVLEVGAGAGLPSIICAKNGARKVVVTDYPDADLIENLEKNCALIPEPRNIHATGYLWGAETAKVREYLPSAEQDAGFDLLILADVLFNHSEHARLLLSIQQTLKKTPDSQALVFFTPYRPWLLEKDLAFFDLAREGGFTVEKILENVMDTVMFEEDRGVSVSSSCLPCRPILTGHSQDELLRRTVFGYTLKWSEESA
jgi:nicotinamide N-methyltransferase